MTFEVSELPSNPYSLGIVLKFLADHEPFSEFEFGRDNQVGLSSNENQLSYCLCSQ